MNLLQSLVKVSGLTLFSRILGFVRDALIARLFGAGVATDAFFVAFKLPNLLRRLFSEGAFSQAFVPMLSAYRHGKSRDEARAFIGGVAARLGLGLTVLSALGMLAAPLLVWLMAPGFSRQPATFGLTVDLLRVTLPYILLISLSSLAGGVLNAWDRFALPALIPALLNLTMIGFALGLAGHFHPPVMTLAWATFAGGCLQLALPLAGLAKLGLLARPRLAGDDGAAWRAVWRVGPAIFSVSVSQVALLINSTFASFLPAGSVSWMYYADRLMEFPTGVLGAALGTILLPALSRCAVAHDDAGYSALIDWGMRLTLLLAAPATVGLALLAGPLTTTLFGYGRFGLHDAAMTRQALVAYALGLIGLILVKVLAPGFFARQNIRTPLRIGLTTLAVTIALDLLLVWPLHHAGLALAIGLSSCLNGWLLVSALKRTGHYRPAPGWPRFLLQLALALAVLAAVLAAGLTLLPSGREALATTRVATLTALIGSGALCYFAALFALGVRPRDFIRQLG